MSDWQQRLADFRAEQETRRRADGERIHTHEQAASAFMIEVGAEAVREFVDGVQTPAITPAILFGYGEIRIAIGRAFEVTISPRVTATRAIVQLCVSGRNFGSDGKVMHVKDGDAIQGITKEDVIDALLDAYMQSTAYRPTG